MRSSKVAMRWGLGALALAVALGCGGEDRQAKLAEARESVGAAEERLASAKEMLEEREERLEEARERYQEAQARVEEAEAKLREARQQVTAHASDALLFRSVQGRLLEEDELDSVAISAAVNDGVVTLTGEVPSEELRDRAAEVAKETAGVVDVVSRIEVVEETSEGG